jgi:hypothetical protein
MVCKARLFYGLIDWRAGLLEYSVGPNRWSACQPGENVSLPMRRVPAPTRSSTRIEPRPLGRCSPEWGRVNGVNVIKMKKCCKKHEEPLNYSSPNRGVGHRIRGEGAEKKKMEVSL